MASWGLLFLPPQSRLEKIRSCLASNHPYHIRKPQQYIEFNDRSNCCGSPTLCCYGVMNDNRYAQRCAQIAAAWFVFKPICYSCKFPSRFFSTGRSGLILERNSFFWMRKKEFSLMKMGCCCVGMAKLTTCSTALFLFYAFQSKCIERYLYLDINSEFTP